VDLFYLMWCLEWMICGIPVWNLGNTSKSERILRQSLERIIDCAQGMELTSDCGLVLEWALEWNHKLERVLGLQGEVGSW